MWLTSVLNFMPNVRNQCYFTGADTFLHVDPFLQTNFMTPHVFHLAPEKWPWPCLFGLKFNTHISHIHLRLNVEAISSNRLDCKDKWRFPNVYNFPFSCSPSCHSFWRNHSVVIWSGQYFGSDITSNRVGVLVNFHLRINGLFCSIRYVYMIFW